jgi:hypothetical protein
MDTRSARDVVPVTRLVIVVAVTIVVLAAVTAVTAVQAAAGTAAGTEVMRGDVVPRVAHLGPTSFTHRGPFSVGETTLTLPTDGAPVEVWYPATKSSVAGKPEATYDVASWLPLSVKKLLPAGYTLNYRSWCSATVTPASGTSRRFSPPGLRRGDSLSLRPTTSAGT